MGKGYFFKIIILVRQRMAEANDLKRDQNQNTKHGDKRDE